MYFFSCHPFFLAYWTSRVAGEWDGTNVVKGVGGQTCRLEDFYKHDEFLYIVAIMDGPHCISISVLAWLN